ncbi:MAG: hypothetical protein LH613_17170 [Chamaesiphon sp.]|nr:hypothetical protein [Chamaesiphon sp.]
MFVNLSTFITYFFPTYYLLLITHYFSPSHLLLITQVTKEEFDRLLGLVANQDTKLYKTPPSQDAIEKLQILCEKTWGTRTPSILDAFAGGGSIPFEAARYGLNVIASDLNPVAWVNVQTVAA